jgi:hypothetical protein
MDVIDLRMLARLQQDARISNVELARAVNLSPSPCQKLGLGVSVLVQVTLEKQIEPALDVRARGARTAGGDGVLSHDGRRRLPVARSSPGRAGIRALHPGISF